MRSTGRIVGIILIIVGLMSCLACSLWAVVNKAGGQLETTGLVFALAGILILALPFFAVGAFLFIRGGQEEEQLAEAQRERRVLDMVLTQGQVRVSDIAIELNVPLDRVKKYVYDLVGKGLFTGYINWDEGVLYSKQASELKTGKCPHCGGQMELAGKGVIRCPYCGAEIFL